MSPSAAGMISIECLLACTLASTFSVQHCIRGVLIICVVKVRPQRSDLDPTEVPKGDISAHVRSIIQELLQAFAFARCISEGKYRYKMLPVQTY